MRKIAIQKGYKNNRLTIIKEVAPRIRKTGYNMRMVLCKCDCGGSIETRLSAVKNGGTKSCGCLQKEHVKGKLRESKIKHGMCGGSIYRVWRGILSRCNNKNTPPYKNYGGRGIKICDRWLDFNNFYKDMGEKPDGKSLDRIDNNGDYEPDNCRWATPMEQCNNTRFNHFITFKGETKTLSEWARKIGVKRNVLEYRIKAGWDIEIALTKPLMKNQFG